MKRYWQAKVPLSARQETWDYSVAFFSYLIETVINQSVIYQGTAYHFHNFEHCPIYWIIQNKSLSAKSKDAYSIRFIF
jgi:hypothetical protein